MPRPKRGKRKWLPTSEPKPCHSYYVARSRYVALFSTTCCCVLSSLKPVIRLLAKGGIVARVAVPEVDAPGVTPEDKMSIFVEVEMETGARGSPGHLGSSHFFSADQDPDPLVLSKGFLQSVE